MVSQDTELSRAVWRTSTYSNNGGNCVEVATNLGSVVAVRDSKDRAGAKLTIRADTWRAFIAGIQDGRLQP